VKNNIYCIKCRLHTDNVEPREEQITSKGKSRSVLKATCSVCSKKKNRFIKREIVPGKMISQEEYDQLLAKFTELQSTAEEFDEKDLK
jgi:hypothetical protein